MKKHISFLICFTATLSLGACSGWLDVKPSTQTDRGELFSTEQGYGEALNGIYTRMCDGSLYGRELTWGAMDLMAGNYSAPLTPALYNALRSYRYVDGDMNNLVIGMIDRFWSEMYNAIAGVNSILGTIDDNKRLFTDDNYNIMKGEAQGLRAFLHFELLRMFGDVYANSKNVEVLPYVTELTPKVTPMLTGENAMNFIIAELKEAVGLLENDPIHLGTTPPDVLASQPTISTGNYIYAWHNRRFHFNYYAAKATLARAYLWKGDMDSKDKALAAALEVIADQPERFHWVRTANLSTIDAGTAAAQDRTFATEHVFALNITDMDNLIARFLTTDSSNPYVESNRLSSQRNMFTTADQGADPRFKYMYTASSATTYMLSKFYQPSMVSAYFKYRLPLIRISEMYYIAAECAPDWRDGLGYLETVRGNRGLGTMPLTGVNSLQTLQDEIYREYVKEFVGEGQLWFYYKRRQSATIANMTTFKGVSAYTFPRPENEELYGNRN